MFLFARNNIETSLSFVFSLSQSVLIASSQAGWTLIAIVVSYSYASLVSYSRIELFVCLEEGRERTLRNLLFVSSSSEVY
jgi:hypothetical protein